MVSVLTKRGMAMEFTVSLSAFDGPLDLMLHLIKENKLDIFDLNMEILAQQYIQYIHSMQDLKLEIASEYIEELAGLIEYKSKKLLPRNEAKVEDNYEEDQREKLVSRLLEYQMFKEASENLSKRYDQRNRYISRDPASLIEEWSVPQEIEDNSTYSVYDLMKAMEKVIKRYYISQPYQTKLSVKEMSIEERAEQIKETLSAKVSPVSFSSLCQNISKRMLILTFLAILSMIHERIISYHIDEKEEIYIERIW